MNKIINAATLSLSFLACLAAVGCVVSPGATADDSAAASANEGPVGTAAQALTGNVVIHNVNSDLALNIFGGSTDQGVPLIQWTADGGHNEIFKLISTSDGYTSIVALYDNICLDLFGGFPVPGQGINQWSCGGGDHQKFTFQQVTPGIYQIKPKSTGMCLQVFNDSTTAGYAVVQAPCVSGKTSQQFYLSLQ
jgi:Ricin-type beta-trefoil lectin domain